MTRIAVESTVDRGPAAKANRTPYLVSGSFLAVARHANQMDTVRCSHSNYLPTALRRALEVIEQSSCGHESASSLFCRFSARYLFVFLL